MAKEMARTTMRADRELLRRLARFQDGPVVNVFVDLDPSVFSTAGARESQVNSLINAAAGFATDDMPHEQRERVRADVDRISAALHDLDVSDARGLAIYAAGDVLFEIVPLPQRIDAGATIAPAPMIAPLIAMQRTERWAIVLVDRRRARVFRSEGLVFEEIIDLEDTVHGKHKQGGWSAARYERSVERDVQIHLQNVSERLLRMFERDTFDVLAIGCPEELWPGIESEFHPYLRERIAGRFDVDVENASVHEVLEAAGSVMTDREVERERSAIERLAEESGRGARAAIGAGDVSRTLDERRVETLLVGLGSETDAEHHIARALDQDAEVIVVKHHTIADVDNLAAILRY